MIVDLVILILVAVMAIFGFYKGFIKSMVSLLGFILSLVLAILFARLVANALLSIDAIGGWVAGNKSLYSWLYSKLPAALGNVSTAELSAAKSSTAIEKLLKTEGVSSWFMSLVYPLVSSGLLNNAYLSLLNNAREIIGLELAYGIFTLAVGTILFIVFRTISAIVSLVFKKYTKGKKKTKVGRIFGAAIGAAKGAAYCMIILCVITFASGIPFMETVNEKVADSTVGSKLTDITTTLTSDLLKGKDNTRYKKLAELSGIKKSTDNNIDPLSADNIIEISPEYIAIIG